MVKNLIMNPSHLADMASPEFYSSSILVLYHLEGWSTPSGILSPGQVGIRAFNLSRLNVILGVSKKLSRSLTYTDDKQVEWATEE